MAGLANYLIYYTNKIPPFENCHTNRFLSDHLSRYVLRIGANDGAASPRRSGEQTCTKLSSPHLSTWLYCSGNASCIFGFKRNTEPLKLDSCSPAVSTWATFFLSLRDRDTEVVQLHAQVVACCHAGANCVRWCNLN